MTQETDQPSEYQIYEEFRDHQDKNYNQLNTVIRNIDTWLFGLSSGALALSITTVMPVVESIGAKPFRLYVYSWALFVLAIISALLAKGFGYLWVKSELKLSSRAAAGGWVNYWDTYRGYKRFPYGRIGEYLNVSCYVFFVFGIISMTLATTSHAFDLRSPSCDAQVGHSSSED